jgi:adenosylhomocysteine nucleosidase
VCNVENKATNTLPYPTAYTMQTPSRSVPLISPQRPLGNLAFKRLGIISALDQEQAGLTALFTQRAEQALGGRVFSTGRMSLHDKAPLELVCALSGIGKVAAAATAASLILHFNCDALLFTGVAGGVGPGVRVGDVVIGTQFVQHDMDVSPLFPRYVLPHCGKRVIEGDPAMSHALAQACAQVLPHIAAHAEVAALVAHTPHIHHGLIASGDRFVSARDESQMLVAALGNANLAPLCVEMEGAAVAQVCHDFEVPFAVLRTISDRADDAAHVDFTRFIEVVASRYSIAVVQAFVEQLLNI